MGWRAFLFCAAYKISGALGPIQIICQGSMEESCGAVSAEINLALAGVQLEKNLNQPGVIGGSMGETLGRDSSGVGKGG